MDLRFEGDDEDKAILLQEVILDATQAAMEVSVDATRTFRGLRRISRGLRLAEWTGIRAAPSGLNRRVVDLSFGSYARPCIEHIQKRIPQRGSSMPSQGRPSLHSWVKSLR